MNARCPKYWTVAALGQSFFVLGWLVLGLLISGLHSCGQHEASSRVSEKPLHALIVTVEGLRADTASWLAGSVKGTGRAVSGPAAGAEQRAELRAWTLDDLAYGGTSWASAYASSPAVLPTLGALWCGKPPLEVGLEHDAEVLPGQQVTLAELARAEGFATAAFVSASARLLAPALGQGFDTISTCADDHATLVAARDWLLARDAGAEQRSLVWVHLTGPVQGEVEDHGSAAEGLEPLMPPANFAELPASPVASEHESRLAYDQAAWLVCARLARFLETCYDPFQRGAETAEVWPRTGLIVCGVGPLLLGENGYSGALPALHESRLRVPLLVHHPATMPGARLRADLVDLVDVVGTVCDWFEWELPPGAVRRSLLDGYATDLPSRTAVVCAYDRVFTVRDANWRLIWNPLRRRVRGLPDSTPMTPEVWLQDLACDPSGARNYASEQPEVVARLQAAIKSWREARRPFPPHLKPVRQP